MYKKEKELSRQLTLICREAFFLPRNMKIKHYSKRDSIIAEDIDIIRIITLWENKTVVNPMIDCASHTHPFFTPLPEATDTN